MKVTCTYYFTTIMRCDFKSFYLTTVVKRLHCWLFVKWNIRFLKTGWTRFLKTGWTRFLNFTWILNLLRCGLSIIVLHSHHGILRTKYRTTLPKENLLSLDICIHQTSLEWAVDVAATAETEQIFLQACVLNPLNITKTS